MADTKFPQWLDKIDVGKVAVLTLDDGECLTADIVRLNDECDELIVDVVSSNQRHVNSTQRGRVIPVEPRSRVEQPWPYSDRCRGCYGKHFRKDAASLHVHVPCGPDSGFSPALAASRFLIALFALQTAALAMRPNLPDWWNTGAKGTPFEIALILLCLGLGYAQVFTNRRRLDRAHREFSSGAV